MTSASAVLRQRLVGELQELGCRAPAVMAAFAAVPRELFVADIAAEQGLEAVYRDEALAAKTDEHGRWLSSSSQPSIMALMLEQLDLRPGHHVLEVGAGTGYNAALLRHIVGPTGRVTSIDIDPELATRAGHALKDSGYRARVVTGDGREGFPRAAPYDRIIATASTNAIPNAWLDQLAPGGRLEVPLRLESDAVSQAITALESRPGSLESVATTWGGFLPLHGGDGGHRAPATSLHASIWTERTPTSLVSVAGRGLERLSDTARRKLLSLLLGDPTGRDRQGFVTVRWPAPPGLLLYLALEVPAARRLTVRTPGKVGIAFVSRDGAHATLASFPTDSLARGERPSRTLLRARRRRWWLECYGAGEPTSEAQRLLARWNTLTRDGDPEFQIVARRGRPGANASVKFRWVTGA